MKKLAAVAVLFALAAPLPAQTPVTQNFQVQLDVDANGKLVRAEPPKDLPPTLASMFDAMARSWIYTVPQRDGHGLPGRTWANIAVTFADNGHGGYSASAHLTNHGPRVDQRFVPYYPSEMLAQRKEAYLIFVATVQPDGTIGDVRFEQTRVSIGTGDTAFRKAIRASLSTWKAQPELVDGVPIATRVRVPVIFDQRPGGVGTPSAFIVQVSAEIAELNKADPAVAPNQAVAIDSPMGIKTPQAP